MDVSSDIKNARLRNVFLDILDGLLGTPDADGLLGKFGFDGTAGRPVYSDGTTWQKIASGEDVATVAAAASTNADDIADNADDIADNADYISGNAGRIYKQEKFPSNELVLIGNDGQGYPSEFVYKASIEYSVTSTVGQEARVSTVLNSTTFTPIDGWVYTSAGYWRKDIAGNILLRLKSDGLYIYNGYADGTFTVRDVMLVNASSQFLEGAI